MRNLSHSSRVAKEKLFMENVHDQLLILSKEELASES